MEHWSIQNCVDEAASIIGKMENTAWHGLRNTERRTIAEMKNDFDQMLVEIKKLKECIGIFR